MCTFKVIRYPCGCKDETKVAQCGTLFHHYGMQRCNLFNMPSRRKRYSCGRHLPRTTTECVVKVQLWQRDWNYY